MLIKGVLHKHENLRFLPQRRPISGDDLTLLPAGVATECSSPRRATFVPEVLVENAIVIVMLVEDHLRLQSKLHRGKTTLTLHMIAVARTLEENVMLLEAEHTFDAAYPKPLCGEIEDPRLVEAAREDPVNQPPAWMMCQAGRNMAAYRKLAEKYPSFRERSKITDLIVEISLQPWAVFRPDRVIIFSDILTPLPAIGVPFDIEEVRGPVIHSTLRTKNELKALHSINFEKLHFVGESLRILCHEVGEQAVVFDFVGAPWTIVAYIEQAAVFGFVGSPWTIAAYIVKGGSTRTYTVIKRMCYAAPHVLKQPLLHLMEAISSYNEHVILD
ncbi:hypothetical protein Nepgr_028896 [Nepenthes gracilis]|uniref:Uroporphyrinogen decarboxylase (URO-D) domain-containing protein n=1 Tax=Nepenthes gracilis TaxID=150966 RepID=A0AAD3TD41_NEPGR|nr:hypothetical protein Nepgr_028896 [Nepenthes gracilis]